MSRPFRFHLLGFPHTATNRDYCHCAYTSKIYKFISMMAPRGHTLIHYGNEGSEMPEPGVSHVEILTEAERASWFGTHDRHKLYDLQWDSNEPYWRLFNERAIEALRPRVQKGDFILSLAGYCQKPIADAFPGSAEGTPTGPMFVEYGIGYYGTFSRYRCYESSSHREWMMGARGTKGMDTDGVVVPNYFDLRDFVVDPMVEERLLDWISSPYYLFLGRVITDKGILVALDMMKDLPEDVRLVVAGQGSNLTKESAGSLYFGAANIEERAVLLKHAIATIMPTLFREPFGGVAVESMLCGTPVITTDQGAFVENVPYEWRCRSHREFVEAAERATEFLAEDRRALAEQARGRWSLQAIAPQYERYFGHLWDRWAGGWYEMRDRTTFGPPPDETAWERIKREESPQAERIAQWMAEHHAGRMILDVGCGPGLYTEAMRVKEIEAIGVDNDPSLVESDYLWRIDVTEAQPMTREFSVVLSLEVGEHIPEEKADAYVDFITNAEPSVVYFSAAQPGQGGEGHINCQPPSYWIEKFMSRGYNLDVAATAEWLSWMRQGPHMGWLLQNGMTFRRVD